MKPNTEHIQRQPTAAEQMTRMIYTAIINSCPQSEGMVAINFPVVVHALFNVVVSVAACDPDLSEKSDVRKFADNARKFLIRAIGDQQSQPACVRAVAAARKAVVGPDGDIVPAGTATGERLQ